MGLGSLKGHQNGGIMDNIDRRILKLLQENARISLKTIAESTFLSSPAVSARIEKMEKDEDNVNQS